MGNNREVFIEEGTTSRHPLTITMASGAPATPESIRYRLMAGVGKQITGWTVVDPLDTELTISALENTIGPDGAKRYLTIEVTHNGGEIITSELEYQLNDLVGVSLPVA